MTPERAAARAEHQNNRDRCPIHHRTLTPTGDCPVCKTSDQAADTVGKQSEYDGDVSVAGVSEALRGRTHARARDQNESREQADLWRYADNGGDSE